WWGLRSFQLALGLDIIVPGTQVELISNAGVQMPTKPIGGGLKFEDPLVGDRLLVVQTTPPALLRIDTSLDDLDEPNNSLLGGVPVCANPNHVEVWTPESGERLALVSCFDADRVAIISLDSWSQVAAVTTGEGPDEIALDPARKLAYVANAKDSSLSVLDLDASSASYLREVARVGP
ncbi:MAG: YncE family protein, partial [Nannocystaceae bacterium]